VIPHVVHCCWFGPARRTKLAERCLASWRRHLPGWEVREWEGASFPIADFRFATDAAKAGRWAAVSDVARFWALERYGGVYLDMDVELLAPIDDLVDRGEFVAAETAPNIPGAETLNPGGGMALERGSPFARAMLDAYRDMPFDPSSEVMDVVRRTLDAALASAAAQGERPAILPAATFSPIGPDGRLRRTDETRAIHWYAMSGYPLRARFARWLAWHGMGGLLELLMRMRGGRK